MTVVVLHSTEGSTIDGAVATLKGRGVASHEVVDVREQLVVQLVSLDRPAKSLLNLKGGVETNNRGGVIQVEIVGYASRSSANGRPGPIMPELDDDELTWLGHYVRQLCAKVAAPFVFPCWFKSYPESYGARNGVRLSFADWLTVEGVIGHQHVPENTHGDPGALDVARMAALSAPPVPLPAPPPPLSTPRRQRMFQFGDGTGAVFLWDGEKVIALGGLGTVHVNLNSSGVAPFIGHLPKAEADELRIRLGSA